MLRAYKYRIYPSEKQAELINKTISCCRLVYNLALETKTTAYKNAGIKLSVFDLCYQLSDLKKEYIWLREVDSQALQASIKKIDAAFKGFFNGKGHPKFKSKNGKQSFQCPHPPKRIDFDKKLLTIPKIKNIPIVLSRPFVGVIKTVTISRSASGKFFASILVDNSIKIPVVAPVDNERTIGIDVGIKSFVVTSDGKIFEPNRFLKKSLRRLKCLQKRASKKKKGGMNRKKSNARVIRLHEKIRNQRIDYCHKITTKLISDNQTDTFVIEDLAVSNMIKNSKLSNAISDVSFGEFFRMIAYKCEWSGKNLIKIGRFEPSSKTCSHCGHIKQDLKLSDRSWACDKCNVIHDRDLNAAKNIKSIGLLKDSRSGRPVEPVESRRIRRAMKQEPIPTSKTINPAFSPIK